MPALPQSEVLAQCLQDIGEKCGDFFVVLQFPGEMATKNSRKILDVFRSAPKSFFVIAATLGLPLLQGSFGPCSSPKWPKEFEMSSRGLKVQNGLENESRFGFGKRGLLEKGSFDVRKVHFWRI